MRPTRVAPKRVKSVASGPKKAKVVAKVRRTSTAVYGDRATWMAVRAKVLARDGNRCTKCPNTTYLQVDHIRPASAGGQTVMHNLRTLCADCHAAQHSSRHSKHLILSKKKKDAKDAT